MAHKIGTNFINKTSVINYSFKIEIMYNLLHGNF